MASLRPRVHLALPLMLLALACKADQPNADSSEDSETEGDGDGDVEELRSDEPHDQDPLLEPGEAEALVAGNYAMTLDLYHALRDGQSAGHGFSVSAYSLHAAFGMLYAGSLEPARSQIAQTLHFELEGERQHVAHNWLDAQLAARNLEADEFYGDAVVLETANSLWMLDDYADGVSTDFLDLLAIHYDAGMKLAAFDSQPELERDVINGWVSERTQSLIPELFPAGSIHEFTTLVVVNALYLKAPWAEPFADVLTTAEDFTRLDNQVVSVDMMRAPYLTSASYAATPEYEATAISLRGWELELVVIVPANFESFEDSLDAARLAEVYAALTSTPLDLHMPKFELESALDLGTKLQDLGMVAPFVDKTSFDAIHENIDVIEVVVQDTVIKIDEDGLEAAAATGIGGDGDGDGDPEPATLMVVDRPFLLAIRDRPTNTLLFFGRVLDPSE